MIGGRIRMKGGESCDRKASASREGAGFFRAANMMDTRRRAFSREEVESASDGRRVYGLRRYLCDCQWFLGVGICGTYTAAMSPSLELEDTF